MTLSEFNNLSLITERTHLDPGIGIHRHARLIEIEIRYNLETNEKVYRGIRDGKYVAVLEGRSTPSYKTWLYFEQE